VKGEKNTDINLPVYLIKIGGLCASIAHKSQIVIGIPFLTA
jgi:hypothetical protein